jgi:magnesium transporter
VTQATDQPAIDLARRDFVAVEADWTVSEALEQIRKQELGEKVVYFYVLEDTRLVGVLPVRRLLMASPERKLRDLMVTRLVSLPDTARVGDVLEAFVMHKLLALPIVDDDDHLIGVVDVGLFTDEVLDFAEKRQVDTMFEAMGVRLSTLRDAGPLTYVRGRFPWLLATIAGGTTCALLAGAFGQTLEASIVLAFFLTLVLGLGESVAAQSMTFAIQDLRGRQPSLKWFSRIATREVLVTSILGVGAGAIAAATVWIWRQDGSASMIIGGSIFVSIIAAGLIGLTVPTVLHALKLDPRIAAGPLALAITDLCTITIYLGLATLVLLT